MTTRRHFIGQCALVALAATVPGILLNSCAAIPVYKTETSTSEIEVPISVFSQSKMVKVRPADSEFDILLIKESNSYKAILLECTHQGYSLNVSSSQLSCPAHGSEFDLNGNVLQGPATRPLKTYSTVINNQQIIINLKS